MTRALIIVESYFGNTRAIAEAVSTGLIEGGVDAQIIDVSQAPSALPADLDLLVLGAPTHNRGASRLRQRGPRPVRRRDQAWRPTGSVGGWRPR